MLREVQGQQVSLTEGGSGEPVIVGLPASFGTARMWDRTFAYLADTHRTIAVDPIGAGRSRVDDRMVTYRDQVSLLEAAIAGCGSSRCVVAAQGRMGTVALEVARSHTQKIAALVLVSAGTLYPPASATQALIAGFRRSYRRTARQFVAQCVPGDGNRSVRSELRSILDETGGSGIARLIESFEGVDVRPLLAEVATPTLFIHGAWDPFEPSSPAAARRSADAMPDALVTVLPEIGHVPTLSRPDSVAGLMLGFCEGR